MMPGVLVTEREFHLKLLAGLQHMDAFEDPLAQVWHGHGHGQGQGQGLVI